MVSLGIVIQGGIKMNSVQYKFNLNEKTNTLTIDSHLPMNPKVFKLAVAYFLKINVDELNNILVAMNQKMKMQEAYSKKAKEKFEKNSDRENYMKNILWILEKFSFDKQENLIYNTMSYSVYGCISLDGKFNI
jgi:hypothetical protein